MSKNKIKEQIYGNPNWINGRINRSEYFVRLILLSIGVSFMAVLAVWAFGFLGKTISGYIVGGICALLALWCYWRIIMAQVKRLHDLNLTGWLALLIVFQNVIVPRLHSPILHISFGILLLILGLSMLFIRGTKGMNKYGKDPLFKYEENK